MTYIVSGGALNSTHSLTPSGANISQCAADLLFVSSQSKLQRLAQAASTSHGVPVYLFLDNDGTKLYCLLTEASV